MRRRARCFASLTLTGTLLILIAVLGGPAARGAVRDMVATVSSSPEPPLNFGFSGATENLAAGSPSSLALWDARAHQLDTQIVRIPVQWSDIAPHTRPPGFTPGAANSSDYHWGGLDGEVRDLARGHFKIMLVIGGAPSWAEGPGVPASVPAGTWEPNAEDFGQFINAIATRYDGHTDGLPRVSIWQAWDEPNMTQYLSPQWLLSGHTWVAQSPIIYRRLENALYHAVKRVAPSNLVVAPATAPYGDPPGGARMRPVTFDQHLFCLTSRNRPLRRCGGPTYLDAIDDHPYVSGLCCHGPTWHAQVTGDTSVADMGEITAVLRAAEAAHTVAPAGRKGVWATELGWNTNPPNPNPDEASPPAQVARWAEQSLYVLWKEGVSTVLWFQLADDPSGAGSDWLTTYTEGLYDNDGQAKPAAQALRFPFITTRANAFTIRAWGRAPAAGTISIQKQTGSSWRTLVRVRVHAFEIFDVPLTQRGSAHLRALEGPVVSLIWTQQG